MSLELHVEIEVFRRGMRGKIVRGGGRGKRKKEGWKVKISLGVRLRCMFL